MELKTNSKCQLILDGEMPTSGLEVIVYGDNYTVVQRNTSETNYWSFDMPEDGLFQYYVLQLNENEESNDILKYIQEIESTPVSEVFSICKLRNCLLQKEKNYISSFLHGCKTSGNCNKTNKESLERDFLLSTIFVLEHLICTGQTTDALRILKNVSSCTICSDNKTTNSCRCNGKNS